MFKRRQIYNPKRKIRQSFDKAEGLALSHRVQYGGNPEHKRNPGDFGLISPSLPRPDKTLCDMTGVFTRKVALELLRKGAERGLVSEQERAGFPQNIWAVSEDGGPFEAQLENPDQGVYHGYPMPETDPFRDEVFVRWKACP